MSRPLSAPGSPKDRTGMMTPGDFASLQEGREGLNTDDYVAWKLPEEEDPEEYSFPLTLKNRKAQGPTSPAMTPPAGGGPGAIGRMQYVPSQNTSTPRTERAENAMSALSMNGSASDLPNGTGKTGLPAVAGVLNAVS